jgi:hypothetical protein
MINRKQITLVLLLIISLAQLWFMGHVVAQLVETLR